MFSSAFLESVKYRSPLSHIPVVQPPRYSDIHSSISPYLHPGNNDKPDAKTFPGLIIKYLLICIS